MGEGDELFCVEVGVVVIGLCGLVNTISEGCVLVEKGKGEMCVGVSSWE